jgi:hypothetical protein
MQHRLLVRMISECSWFDATSGCVFLVQPLMAARYREACVLIACLGISAGAFLLLSRSPGADCNWRRSKVGTLNDIVFPGTLAHALSCHPKCHVSFGLAPFQPSRN